MSTGTELSALLTTYLHNDAAFSAANKLTYLNLGLKRIMRDAPLTFRRKEATLSITVVGGREYSLATDFYLMIGIWYADGTTRIQPMIAGEFIDEIEKNTIASGTPEYYTILGYDESLGSPAWRIKFDKTPSDSMTITYWYVPVPTAITGGGTPGISSMGYDELLIWASVMIALQPKDPEGYASAHANYQENLRQWIAYRANSPDYTPMLRGSIDSDALFPLNEHFPS